MTVTVIALSPVVLSAMVAAPLIITGLMLRFRPPAHVTARLTGAGLAVSGWLVLGVGQGAGRDWWMAGADVLIALVFAFHVLVADRRRNRGQQ